MPRVTSRDRLGASFRFAVAILRPTLMVLTKRDWRGVEHLDTDGGIVLAINHISYADPLVVAHFCYDNDRPPRFLAKDSVFRIPVFGRILTGARQIPVVRGTPDAALAVQAAVTAVRSGECVVVYPEGTLTRDPGLWPMTGRSGAARIALTAGVPVVPAAIWGPQEIMGPYEKALRLLPRKTMRVLVGPPVDLDDLAGRPLTVDVLDEATDRILDAITRQVAALRGEAPPAVRFDYAASRRQRSEST